MDWFGSPTAVTPTPEPAASPCTPNSDRSITSCASEVSWNSSSSTARNRVRSVTPMAGTDRASRAANAIWSPKSMASRLRLRSRYARTIGRIARRLRSAGRTRSVSIGCDRFLVTPFGTARIATSNSSM